jgi:hypothetical protein
MCYAQMERKNASRMASWISTTFSSLPLHPGRTSNVSVSLCLCVVPRAGRGESAGDGQCKRHVCALTSSALAVGGLWFAPPVGMCDCEYIRCVNTLRETDEVRGTTLATAGRPQANGGHMCRTSFPSKQG